MKKLLKKFNLQTAILLKTMLLLLLVTILSCNSTKYVNEGEYLLNSYEVLLDNPKQVNIDELDLFIKQKPNKKIVNYPFYLNVFYNSIDPVKEAKREEKRKKEEDAMNHKRELKGKAPREKFYVTRWIRHIGEAPVIFDKSMTLATDKEFSKYLINRGFYFFNISDTATFKDKKVNVKYIIETGKPYVIESVTYDLKNRDITNIIQSKTSDLPLKAGLFFDTDSMQSQRMKMTDILKDKGYFLFQKEYFVYEADTTLGDKKVAITIKMQQQLKKDEKGNIIKVEHEKFDIGEIKMFTDFDPKIAIFDSSAYYSNLTANDFNNITFYHKSQRKLFHPSVLVRGLKIYEDSTFNLNHTKTSRQYLSSLGVFKTVNLNFIPSEEVNAKGNKVLNCKIQLTPTVPQSYKLELEGSISGGWRTEASVNYEHRNLFKSATSLNLTLSTALERINSIPVEDNRIFNNEKYGAELSITIPKFLSPFRLTSFNQKYLPKTNLAAKIDYQRRYDYTRTVINANYGYFWKSSTYVTHNIKLADLYATKIPQLDTSYLAYLVETNNFDRFFDHFILGSAYTYLYTNKRQTRRINFNFFKFDIEWAGNLLYASHQLAKAEKTKGSEIFASIINPYAEILQKDPEYASSTLDEIKSQLVTTLDQDNSAYTIFGLDYKQYIKSNVDFHQTFFMQGKMSWAYRVAAGAIIPYGNSQTAPVIKQFYVGGANSIRAWAPREIGPGSREAVFDANGDIIFYESYGDIFIEANAEYRFNIWWMFDGAIFADAGNVWMLDNQNIQQDAEVSENDKRMYFNVNRFYKEFALNTGFGLRMDMDFLIVRFDIGVPLFDPRIEQSNWVWGQGKAYFKRPQLTFGIGLPF